MSDLEDQFAYQVKLAKLPEVVQQYRFHTPRRWAFDFAWPDVKVAVEIEGGVWMAKSRHTSGVGFVADCVKYNQATVDGWRVLRFTAESVKDGSALEIVELLLDRLYGLAA